MKPRTTIFLSGVSHELGSFRDAVEVEIQKKGCFADNQPGFATDHRTIEEMLRRRLHDCDAVIQLAGFRTPAMPPTAKAPIPAKDSYAMRFSRPWVGLKPSARAAAGATACKMRVVHAKTPTRAACLARVGTFSFRRIRGQNVRNHSMRKPVSASDGSRGGTLAVLLLRPVS
jgi:hypothetical protein